MRRFIAAKTIKQTYKELITEFKARNTGGPVELDDVYVFLSEMYDEWPQALIGAGQAKKQWYHIKNIIELMPNWFVPIK